MEVTVDLLKRGFSVYRNVTPVGPVDMVAVSKDGYTIKVQATTGKVNQRAGARSYDAHGDVPHWNILAVAYPDGVRYYTRNRREIALPDKGWLDVQEVLARELQETKAHLMKAEARLEEVGVSRISFTPKDGGPSVEVDVQGMIDRTLERLTQGTQG
jgi:hypothetical protein